ncbi:MAG: HYR domain-containing protein [Flavobacteriales bacterium]|nr:HYR domain-containing protein [Flavobacteriales bacterium]MCB9195749.1 HYR domain-containing protein [Flavobacteriales bacterium]MCB9198803.1 HYR domain-containing protein [Flavobacteriales bacterium]
MGILVKPISIITLVLGLFSTGLNAQVIKSFTQRSSSYTPSKLIYNIRGDYTMVGNTNLTLQSYGNNINNSNNVMIYVDVDSDPNTWNSSSATLEFSTENGAIPECSNIVYAGLYWTGRSSDASSSPEEFTVTKSGVSKTFNKRKISLKGPGQSSYTLFEANPGNIYYPDGVNGNMYSAYVEVTDYVKNNGIGEYFAADIALVEGDGGATGYYGGWGMIIVYENSKMNWRDVTIFDGHAYVKGNSTINYDLPVSGFHTVQSGQVNMKLGLMAGEGDVGISGDYFRIRNWQDNAWITLSHSGNTTTNFFNGSVNTGGNPRNPALQNNTGLDIAMFDIPNTGNTVITNNQTSTTFRYGSTQDTYIIFCIAMSVDAYIPDVEALISAEYINGVPASGTVTAEPGDTIEYSLQITNPGTEAIDDLEIILPLPYTTDYLSGSLSTSVNFTPLPSPNDAHFDPLLGPTGSIVWDFGTLPLPPAGFSDSVLAEISFQFVVTQNCQILTNPDCPPQVILSGGHTTGVGAVSGSSFDLPFIQGYETSGICVGEPISDPLVMEIDAAQFVVDSCNNVGNIRDFVFCNYEDATIPFDSVASLFPDGLRFYNTNNVTPSSIEYDETNPFPATPGTSVYFAIPEGYSSCYYTFYLTVQDPIITYTVVSENESCIGEEDGEVDLTILGGITPITYEWTGPSSYSSTNEDITSLGEGMYYITITDSLGCQASDSAEVITIPDNDDPSLVCPLDINVNNNLGVCGANVTYTTPIGTDNCPGATTVMLQGLASGSLFSIGTTLVEYEATDLAGNTATCSFNVTVTDNEDPVVTS